MSDKWKTQTCRYCKCLKKHKSCGNPEHNKLPPGEQLVTFPCSLGIGFSIPFERHELIGVEVLDV